MQDLTITIFQSKLHWEDIEANLNMFGEKIAAIGQPTDIIILPEMFNTGFTMNAAKLAEGINGKTVKWMTRIAKDKECVITGSLIIRENSNYFNRLIWMPPDSDFQAYDKRHLFRLAKEEQTYAGGNKRLIATLGEWKICPQICYDLRFPVWSRNNDDYDLLLFVANWPERRSTAWKSLLQARAIENIAYVAGLNRVGNDGNDVYHSGDSSIINYKGDILYQKADEEDVFTITLSKSELEKFRSSFPFYRDADTFEIK